MDGRNYINGEWTAAQSEGTFERRNPAHNPEVLGVFPHSDGDDVDRAVRAARGDASRHASIPSSRSRSPYGQVASCRDRRSCEASPA